MLSTRLLVGAMGLTAIVACGGGGDTGTTPTPPPPPPVTTVTGRMIDDPVQGLHYGTTMDPALAWPTDFSRVTGPNGEYTFSPGEAVIFKIGNLVLGNPSPATGIFTPSQMAANQTQLQDILILLQSLDQDGNPFNGIVIPPGAADAFTDPSNPVTSSAFWSMAPATFASSANSWLVRAQQLGGITTGIINPAQASANFLRQFLQLVAINTWGDADATTFTFVRADTSGNYLMAQAKPADPTGQSGVEAGKITAAGFDKFGWVWSTPLLSLDTNGEWGLSNLHSCERVNIIGTAITSTDCTGASGGGTIVMVNDPAGIVGAWALNSTTNVKTLTLLFFTNGRFAVIDPTGSTATPSCGGPGVEFGSYTYDAAAKILKVSNLLYDTDGCAGLSGTTAASGSGLAFTIASGGATATYNDGSVRNLYRVSR